MEPNQVLQTHGASSLPPTLPCPYCPRYFHRKGGRTRHIQAKHPANESEPPSPGPSACPAPISPLPQLSFHGSNSIPSDFMSPHPPSQYGFNTDTNMDTHSDRDYTQPEHNGEVDGNVPGSDPDPSRITCTYHPKLDGMLIFLLHIHLYKSCYV